MDEYPTVWQRDLKTSREQLANHERSLDYWQRAAAFNKQKVDGGEVVAAHLRLADARIAQEQASCEFWRKRIAAIAAKPMQTVIPIKPSWDCLAFEIPMRFTR